MNVNFAHIQKLVWVWILKIVGKTIHTPNQQRRNCDLERVELVISWGMLNRLQSVFIRCLTAYMLIGNFLKINCKADW